MELFRQENFLGLTTEVNSTKQQEGFSSLIINSRVLRNTVKPIKAPVNLMKPRAYGKVQGIFAVRDWLLVAIAGNVYYRELSTANASWSLIPGWSAMSQTADRIYFQPVPLSSSQYEHVPDATDASSTKVNLNGNIAQSPQGLLTFDGINQPRIIFPDATFKIVKAYNDWTKSEPEYMPRGCKLATFSGNKLFVVNKDGNKIYTSVTGRPLDFVINRDSTGDKGGDADTTAKAVSYDSLTGLVPTGDGGILALTLEATYQVQPDYNFPIFGEPFLRDRLIMPVGAVNADSVVDILGDTAFISQSGIHSINITAQAHSESNNFPLGAQVESLLDGVQQDTCAITFDTYALFAVNTIHGPGVLTLDRRTKRFVSLDLAFGRVKQFASQRKNGVRRLFYITHSNEIFEAFAGEPAVARIYLGDFTSQSPQTRISLSSVHLEFLNVSGSVPVRTAVYADGDQISDQQYVVTATDNPENPPRPLPFNAGQDAKVITTKAGKATRAFKVGAYVEWQGEAELTSAVFEGKPNNVQNINDGVYTQESTELFVFTADHGLGDGVVTDPNILEAPYQSTLTKWENLTVGNWYCADGKVHLGDEILYKTVFQATDTWCYYDGVLADVTNLYNTFRAYNKIKPKALIGGGDHLMGSTNALGGSEQARHRFEIVFKNWLDKFYMAPGNHDLDTNDGREFYSLVRRPVAPWAQSFLNVTFIFVDDGLKSDMTDYNGYDRPYMEQQLRTILNSITEGFKVIVFHHPPYSDSEKHGPTQEMQLDFAGWGAHLVLNGHNHNYQRFSVNGIPYVTAGTGGSGLYTAKKQLAKVVYDKSHGYLRLDATRHELRGTFILNSSEEVDQFTIAL